MRRVCATGHRLDKLGRGTPDELDLRLFALADHYFSEHAHQVDEFYCGMAIGWDMATCEAALVNQVCTVACVPFKGQEDLWPAPVQNRYRQLLARCARVVYVSSPGYERWKMNYRNHYMVDQLTGPDDYVLALWNGTAGGTKNAVDYAVQRRVRVENLWREWVTLTRVR